MKQVAWIGILILALLSGVLVAISNAPKSIEKDQKSQFLKGGDFTLTSLNGELSLNQLSGAPTLLYFGFTFCPDICPIGLTVIRDAVASDDRFGEVNVLFVTLDPERDTPQRLKEYLDFFDPNFIGLSGSVEEITEVAKRYGTYFAKAEETAPGEYSVDHTAYYYVIDQNGELVRVLNHDTDAESIVSILNELI